MKLLRAATLSVADLERSVANYRQYFDYSITERGEIDAGLAASWGTPASAGQPYAILQPASGADVYVRLIEQPAVAGFQALRSYGWNAIEICVENVLATHARMAASPFEVIGPPREIAGLPAIHPMQVKGPDEEIIYLTQIKDDLPDHDLPRAGSPIDKLFILVMGCSDLDASAAWMRSAVGLDAAGPSIDIVYTMLARAYDTPLEHLYTILTLGHERDVFLELDQYPDAAIVRARHKDMLPPGCAIGTLWHPDFDALTGPWISPPMVRDGPIYNGKRVATLRDPDGALLEIVEG